MGVRAVWHAGARRVRRVGLWWLLLPVVPLYLLLAALPAENAAAVAAALTTVAAFAAAVAARQSADTARIATEALGWHFRPEFSVGLLVPGDAGGPPRAAVSRSIVGGREPTHVYLEWRTIDGRGGKAAVIGQSRQVLLTGVRVVGVQDGFPLVDLAELGIECEDATTRTRWAGSCHYSGVNEPQPELGGLSRTIEVFPV